MLRVRRPLTVAQILAWADAHFARTGTWPRTTTGRVHEDRVEKWRNIDSALREGLRGLPGGDSLARLLDRERGVRNVQRLPPLTEGQVVAWAREHHARTGGWPGEDSGVIPRTRGEVWQNVNQALREGGRGFPGGDSLAHLLARRLGIRNRASIPALTEELILMWADRYRCRTGCWPQVDSGAVEGATGETWRAVDQALRHGLRTLPGGDSLHRLLQRCLASGRSRTG
jgi:hypothetical protein